MIKEIKFEELKEGEKVLLILRRHWVTLIPLIFKKVILFLAVLFFGFWIWRWGLLLSFYFSLVIFGLLIFVLVASVYDWILWYQDVYIITNKRIINIQRKSLFTTVVSEASLDKIQDITYKIEGVLPTIFNYGTVIVQTAAAIGVLNLEDVERPSWVIEKIKEACKMFEEEEGGVVTAEDLIEAIKEKKKEEKKAKRNKEG